MIPPIVTSLATCSSAACIPVNIEATKKIGVSDDIAETMIPIGANLHKDGSIIGSVFKILFLACMFGMDVANPLGILKVLVVALVASRDRRLKETDGIRKSIFLLSAVSVLAICTSLYVWWTPAGSSRIVGLQGRYFLPLMPGVIMAGMKKDEIHPTNRAEQTVMKLAMTDIWAIAFVFLSTVV